MARAPKASGKRTARATTVRKPAPVLPPSPTLGGSIGDLLTDDERRALRHDLAKLARMRREAQASAATFQLS